MKLLKGNLYLDRVHKDRLVRDDTGRVKIEVVVVLNDEVLPNGKAGVVQQATLRGEMRIYLANLFIVDYKTQDGGKMLDGLMDASE